jgi:rubredoxin
MSLLPDETCPECRGKANVTRISFDRVGKRCTECAHMWAEERPKPLFERGGWIRLRGGVV